MNLRRVLTIRTIGTSLFLIALAALSYTQYRLYQKIQQLDWKVQLSKYNRPPNSITLDVGVIQFLERGFSITLDSVIYEPSGVKLTGQIGNPNLLTVSSLTVTFAVNREIYQFRDLYLKDPIEFLLTDKRQIGKAQVSVGELLPGSSVPFQVSIPNVKQGSERYEVVVTFSGERYQYTS